MSVTIRLARTGRKNLPTYKIVVSNTRDKRNGRFVDIIGSYNPTTSPQEFVYNKEKFEKWSKTGALITEAVKKLVEGKYEYKKYEPKKVKASKEDQEARNATKDNTTKEEKAEDQSKEEANEQKEEKKEENK
ncbi:30S ribosomal protein S16 [candidate division WWE3 bacterium]|uniref:Small ribosomal subunit protein bS16 n=1 Tax=candidate division WWE3 bacterium TaxID=2053526 RepID=A0A7X9E722_UNCKA|nr:30S ribosomal protein S16 [candidate division WWE3 bacterium]